MKRYVEMKNDRVDNLVDKMKNDLQIVFQYNNKMNSFWIQKDEIFNHLDAETMIRLSNHGSYDLIYIKVNSNCKYSSNDFYLDTFANWTEAINPPKEEADYVSNSGSQYFFTKEGVYRLADHWTMNVASCSWVLDGKEVEEESKIGFCRWEDFRTVERKVVYDGFQDKRRRESLEYYLA